MGLVRRVNDLFKAKASKALDRAEDPREVLDYAYHRQTELLQQVRRGLADVATSRKRIELQRTQLDRSAATLQDQAQRALAAGRDDLAREALTRRTAALEQDQELQTQLTTLQAEEEKLTTASKRLEAQVDDFRTRKETIKASYTAAEAQTRIGEATTGISEQMGDVGSVIQRAQDRTEQLQARAGALDELMASGALEDATSPTAHDDLRDELDAITAGDGVEAQLAAMKAELAAGPGAGADSPASLERGAQEPGATQAGVQEPGTTEAAAQEPEGTQTGAEHSEPKEAGSKESAPQESAPTESAPAETPPKAPGTEGERPASSGR